MGAFEALADPVRRRIVELLAEGEQPAGALGRAVQQEFGISQPGPLSISGYSVIMASCRSGQRVLVGSTRWMLAACPSSTAGLISSVAPGTSRSTHWRPNWLEASASGAEPVGRFVRSRASPA